MESDKEIVIAHDQMWVIGGAERVALRIGEALDAPVYTPYAGNKAMEVAEKLGVEIVPFAQDEYDGVGRIRRVEGFKSASLALRWQTAPLNQFDLIFSAHMFSRHYRTLDHQYMLNYCHSPPRWLNDLQRHRLESLPAVARLPAKLYMSAMDLLDARSSDRVDAFVANSEVIRERIRRYYRRDATIVYPPIDTESIKPTDSKGDYYLMVGRVVGAKRPMTVLEAFEGTNKRLKIAGEGDNEPLFSDSTFTKVKRAAGSNVDVLGYVSDERRIELLQNAKAVIYVPVREDFGMVPIEALAAGTPVIAANEGFPAIAIDDGTTGVIVDPTPEGIRDGIDRVASIDSTPAELATAAEKYGVDRFHERISSVTERFLANPDMYRVDEPSLIND